MLVDIIYFSNRTHVTTLNKTTLVRLLAAVQDVELRFVFARDGSLASRG